MKRTQRIMDLHALYLKSLNEEDTGYVTDEENEVEEVEALDDDKEALVTKNVVALAPQIIGAIKSM